MATTTPTPTPAQSIGEAFLKYLPIIELGSNIALLALGANGVIPSNTAAVASTIEGGVNPLIASIKAGASAETDAVIALSAEIAALNVLKNNKALDQATLAKVTAYSVAAQAALAGWISGGQGFDPSKLTPVDLIV